ncbi:MAG: PKD domain-containing protein [Bacteroidetes bacterium]|nr:PKD domain-containing protein [Bacteroidota bacterium]
MKKKLHLISLCFFVFCLINIPRSLGQESIPKVPSRQNVAKEIERERAFEREKRGDKRTKFERKRDGALQAIQRDVMMMKDPALGIVPGERILVAKKYKDQLMQSSANLAPLAGVSWDEQGPNNQGGRTRALMVDPNDVSGNTVFAGSVSGGLWKTTNINAASPVWTPVNDLLSNLAVISIAYDPTNTQVMYFCTGEGYNNIDNVRGLGVFKSTNGGVTWTQIASTNNATFYYCQKVVVNSAGVVFVATSSGGLQRSANGGTTWTKVLGSGLLITGATSNFCYDVEIAADGDVYSSLDGSVHKSTNAGVTFGAAQTIGVAGNRIELACAPNDSNYVYAVVEAGGAVAGITRTINGGTSWTVRTEPADVDPDILAADFSRGQAWYDLTVAVDPNNRERLFVGGIDLFVSTDGAGTWSQVSHWYGGFSLQNVHADQHNIVFQNGSSSVAYFVNDGGVYRSTNANVAVPTIVDKSSSYRTAQFYACAMHPTALTPYYLAGSQDNGTHKFVTSGIQATTQATGGDGAFCHIDQNQPQFQFTQYVYNDYYRSSDGGNTWTNVVTAGGSFINPSDYDDANNKMYAASTTNQFVRWDDPQTGGTFVTVAAAALNGWVSAVKVSPNTANKVFFGSDNGRVVRVENAHTGAPTITNISTGLPAGAYVSCVEVETGNDNHLLVTFSSYGVNSVWESTNGGTSWTSVEGNLPDMPIRWALFNPNNNDQVLLATELGVWSTDNLNAGATVWGATNSGLANVRVDMLQLRQSDKYVIAATHGRGLYASDLFTSATANFHSDIQLSYINKSIQFISDSYQATTWSWNFGDGTPASTLENPTHSYAVAGKYNVTLTINGGASVLTKNLYIHILPNRGTPYVVASDGGTFEINPNDFGAQSISGNVNKWERGVPGNALSTANSPVNVWKTDLDADVTEGDYACALQTPSFNMTAGGTYTLRFRQSMEVVFCNAPLGVQLQYSTNKGSTWTRLGVNSDPNATNWYNRGPATGCPIDASIFADQYGWTTTSNNTLCTYNLTTGVPALVGQGEVTFRFVLSVKPGYGASSYLADGFMVDDFEILGPLNAPFGAAPSIVTTGTLTPFSACSGTASAQQSFTVSGSGLTTNLIVTPPTGFEVSLTSGSGFASSLSLTPSSGNVSTTTIFVRMASTAVGTPSGNIVCSTTGASQNVFASGTVNALPTPSITGSLTFCTGGSTTLNAGSFSSYLWSTGANTQTIVVNTANTFTVTVTNGNGCTGSASATTSITPITPPIITSSENLVLMSQDFETGALPPGWTATGLWHITNACVSGTPPNPTRWAYYGIDGSCTFNNGGTHSGNLTSNTVAIPAAATSATLSFKYAYNGEGGAYPSGYDNSALLISVNGGAFAPIFNLSTTGSGGSWLNASVNLAPYAGSTIALQWNFNTVDNIGNDYLGLQLDSISIKANNGFSFCSGGSVNLNASAGYSSYVWSTGANTSGISVAIAGNYTVTVTSGSCTSSATAIVTVNPNPTPAITGNISQLLFYENFESGSLPSGWSVTGLWHVTNACVSGTPPNPNYWAYYGLDGTCNFNTGTTNSGNMYSPPIAVPANAADVKLRFRYAYAGEAGIPPGGWDWASANISVNGGPYTLLGYLSNTGSNGSWLAAQYDLSSYAGDTVIINWNYNSVDAVANNFLGMQIDSIAVVSNASVNFCSGSNVVLSAGSGSGNFLWSTGATTSTIAVTAPGNYSVTETSINGCSGTAATNSLMYICPLQLNLKAFIEGYYLGGGLMQAVVNPTLYPTLADTITVELRNSIAPYALEKSVKGTLNTSGNGQFIFPGNLLSRQYYIVVKTRNTIETWSKLPVLMDIPVEMFDFTTP